MLLPTTVYCFDFGRNLLHAAAVHDWWGCEAGVRMVRQQMLHRVCEHRLLPVASARSIFAFSLPDKGRIPFGVAPTMALSLVASTDQTVAAIEHMQGYHK